MKLGKIAHACIVVEDISAAADHYSRLFGIKHWYELVRTSDLDLYYKGEKRNSDVKIWLGGKGHTAIELIQSRGDENLYTTYLKDFGEGIHHLQYYVKDLKKAIAEFEKEGLQVLQSACFYSKGMKVDYVYMGKDEHSAAFELIEATLPGGIKKGDLPFEILLGRLTGNMRRVK